MPVDNPDSSDILADHSSKNAVSTLETSTAPPPSDLPHTSTFAPPLASSTTLVLDLSQEIKYVKGNQLDAEKDNDVGDD